jgi:hypothetical protein
MMTDGQSMETAEENVMEVSEATQRRPDFCAEALSPGVRIGLLMLELLAAGLLVALVGTMAAWPQQGLLAVNELLAVMLIGCCVGLTFVVLLVYGALLANNPRLSGGERTWWYVLFAVAGPVTLPAYWLMHVWPVRYEPVVIDAQKYPHKPETPPYVRRGTSTSVLPEHG